MPGPNVGDNIKVRYVDDYAYTFDVNVTALSPSNNFVGRINRIFSDHSEITGGKILALIGQERTFPQGDILFP